MSNMEVPKANDNEASSGELANRVLTIAPEDWFRAVYPEIAITSVEEMPANFVQMMSNESVTDFTRMINKDIIFHCKLMNCKDLAFPYKMMRYRADIWEYYSNESGFTYDKIKPIYQVAILMDPSCDNGVSSIVDNLSPSSGTTFSYPVIKVWELDAKDIVERKLEGLYPLLPLMKNEAGASKPKICRSYALIKTYPAK
ncbi:MAG: hypothetical protein LBC41_01350 [Clostridiales bacterium]|nr:hypothetical protein [Clostridiales bacterium]